MGDLSEADDQGPAKLRFLPPPLRPEGSISSRELRVFLLSGMAILYAGYDLSIFGLAIPQIQATMNIPEDRIGITFSLFRLAAIMAIIICACADIVGRRRLLLLTIVGQAAGTLLTAVAGNYMQLVAFQIFARACGFSEEILCLVMISEEISAKERGWANGVLSALYSAGAGLASIVFAAVTLLPFGWRGIFAFGSVQLLLIAYFRRDLPESKRFELRREELRHLTHNAGAALGLLRSLIFEHPVRLLTLMIAVATFGFSVAPASVLAYKYMQQSLGFSPVQTTFLFVPCAIMAAALNIMIGKLSDKRGRRLVIIGLGALSAAAYAVFYSGYGGMAVAGAWVAAYLAYLAADALMSGLASEIFPTAYRATVSALRLTVQILAGALSLALEGQLYHWLGGHGPAAMLPLVLMPVALIALLLLPEPAGKSLEQLTAR